MAQSQPPLRATNGETFALKINPQAYSPAPLLTCDRHLPLSMPFRLTRASVPARRVGWKTRIPSHQIEINSSKPLCFTQPPPLIPVPCLPSTNSILPLPLAPASVLPRPSPQDHPPLPVQVNHYSLTTEPPQLPPLSKILTPQLNRVLKRIPLICRVNPPRVNRHQTH